LSLWENGDHAVVGEGFSGTVKTVPFRDLDRTFQGRIINIVTPFAVAAFGARLDTIGERRKPAARRRRYKWWMSQ
ncbi:MAG: hypothetical protein ACRD18_14205, partial [Terriglobia bacterium]